MAGPLKSFAGHPRWTCQAWFSGRLPSHVDRVRFAAVVPPSAAGPACPLRRRCSRSSAAGPSSMAWHAAGRGASLRWLRRRLRRCGV
jgi:hypothetical protein